MNVKRITITCVFRFKMHGPFYRRPLMSPAESFAYDLREVLQLAKHLKELKQKIVPSPPLPGGPPEKE